MQPIRLSRYAPFMRRTLVRFIVPMLIAAACTGVAFAQRRGFGGGFGFREGSLPARYAPEHMPDADFVICRLSYSSVRREEGGIGWLTDYPFSEIHLTTRLAEITKTRVSRDSEGTPNYYVVRPTDDALFNCPMIVASDVGTIGLEPKEIARLREYFLKGGFLWVDDFWGTEAWEQWAEQIQEVLPSPDFRIEDLPLTHPLFHAMFGCLIRLASTSNCDAPVATMIFALPFFFSARRISSAPCSAAARPDSFLVFAITTFIGIPSVSASPRRRCRGRGDSNENERSDAPPAETSARTNRAAFARSSMQ